MFTLTSALLPVYDQHMIPIIQAINDKQLFVVALIDAVETRNVTGTLNNLMICHCPSTPPTIITPNVYINHRAISDTRFSLPLFER